MKGQIRLTKVKEENISLRKVSKGRVRSRKVSLGHKKKTGLRSEKVTKGQ